MTRDGERESVCVCVCVCVCGWVFVRVVSPTPIMIEISNCIKTPETFQRIVRIYRTTGFAGLTTIS